MGRYLSVGIVSRIEIIVEGKDEDFINMKFVNSISKSLNKYINTKDYDKEYYKDGIAYRLKENIFNDNFHDLIKEINKDINLNKYLERKFDFKDPKFNKEDYPIILKTNLDPESDNFGDQRIVIEKTNKEYKPYECPYIYNNRWLIDDNDYKYDVKVNIEAFSIWESFDKIRCESEYITLKIINDLKKKYKNKLGENVIFFIFG